MKDCATEQTAVSPTSPTLGVARPTPSSNNASAPGVQVALMIPNVHVVLKCG